MVVIRVFIVLFSVGPSLKLAIDIIKSREGSCETNRGEFELDLNKFQPSTLRALETYIASVVGEKYYCKYWSFLFMVRHIGIYFLQF